MIPASVPSYWHSKILDEFCGGGAEGLEAILDGAIAIATARWVFLDPFCRRESASAPR